mmetsp:Transcript_7661/g.47292  ORF Transcript_7661/g.47292 Transcript_7661/m.47292 type:complete len:294 (+) Transcript_7661:1717-2598(+)
MRGLYVCRFRMIFCFDSPGELSQSVLFLFRQMVVGRNCVNGSNFFGAGDRCQVAPQSRSQLTWSHFQEPVADLHVHFILESIVSQHFDASFAKSILGFFERLVDFCQPFRIISRGRIPQPLRPPRKASKAAPSGMSIRDQEGRACGSFRQRHACHGDRSAHCFGTTSHVRLDPFQSFLLFRHRLSPSTDVFPTPFNPPSIRRDDKVQTSSCTTRHHPTLQHNQAPVDTKRCTGANGKCAKSMHVAVPQRHWMSCRIRAWSTPVERGRRRCMEVQMHRDPPASHVLSNRQAMHR